MGNEIITPEEFMEITEFIWSHKDWFRSLKSKAAIMLISMIMEENCNEHGLDVVKYSRKVAETIEVVNAIAGKYKPNEKEEDTAWRTMFGS